MTRTAMLGDRVLRQLATAMLLVVIAERRCTSPPPKPIETASATAFADSVGVNVHLQYAETAYEDADRVDAAIAFLGVRHLRDSAWRRGPDEFAHYVALARSGHRFDLFFNAELQTQLARAKALEQAVPGAIATAEGPNEVNNDPVRYRGLQGVQAAQAYQAALYVAVHRDPSFRGAPVLNYTNYPASFGQADAVNVHTYARAGASPGLKLASDIAAISASLPSGLPVYVTETGYTTAGQGASKDAVSPQNQAALTLVALLDAFRAGAKRTYLYELLDEHADTTAPSDPEHHYGLFDAEGRPKPAALALRTVMQLVSQPATARDVNIAENVQVSGVGARHLTLTAPGRAVLFVWRETSAQSAGELAEINLPAPCSAKQVSLEGANLDATARTRSWSVRLDRAPAVFAISCSPQVGSNSRPLAPSNRPAAMLR